MDNDVARLVEEFHHTWDTFPGVARIIDRKHKIIAANPIAEKAGFTVGVICAKVGAPKSHRDCKMMKMFQTGETQIDHVLPDRIRGWMPIPGQPDLCIHFGLPLLRE